MLQTAQKSCTIYLSVRESTKEGLAVTLEAKKKFIINAAFIALLAVLLYFVLKYVVVWLLPFVIGFLCAMVLQWPVRVLSEKTRVPRTVWSIVLVIVILSLLFALIAVLGYELYNQSVALIKRLTADLPNLQGLLGSLNDRLSGLLNGLPKGIADSLRSLPEKLAANASSYLGSLARWLANLATNAVVNVPGLLLTTLLSIIACCFITNDYYKITGFILHQLPARAQQVLLKSKRVFVENIGKMLRGYLIIMGITCVELLVGFLILGISSPLTLALVVALVDVMPVLGVGTVLIPWGIIDLFMGKTFLGIGLLVLYLLIAALRNVWEPKIIGTQVGLPAIVTLMAMYLGLKLFGFVGLWALPILIIIVAKLQEAGMIRIWKNPGAAVPADDLTPPSDPDAQLP